MKNRSTSAKAAHSYRRLLSVQHELEVAAGSNSTKSSMNPHRVRDAVTSARATALAEQENLRTTTLTDSPRAWRHTQEALSSAAESLEYASEALEYHDTEAASVDIRRAVCNLKKATEQIKTGSELRPGLLQQFLSPAVNSARILLAHTIARPH